MTDETTAQAGTGMESAAHEARPPLATEQTADAGTLLGGETTAETLQASAPADWPADWRQKLAGEDKKTLERLGRMASPADLLKSYRALEQKISAGELRKGLPENATPEQVAEWRREQGLPEKPEGYLENLSLPDGVVLGEADKPMAAAFAEAALDGNTSPEAYSKLVAKYFELQDKIVAERAEADRAFKLKAEDELRAEWGAEFRPNLNAVKNLLAAMPEGAADNLLSGRLADGTKIGDHPGIVKWLASISRDLNPTATLVPAGSGNAGKSVNDEIASIEKLMGDRSSDYWRGPKANEIQQRYRSLIEARDKITGRAA